MATRNNVKLELNKKKELMSLEKMEKIQFVVKNILGWPKSSFSLGTYYSIKFLVKMTHMLFICT